MEQIVQCSKFHWKNSAVPCGAGKHNNAAHYTELYSNCIVRAWNISKRSKGNCTVGALLLCHSLSFYGVSAPPVSAPQIIWKKCWKYFWMKVKNISERRLTTNSSQRWWCYGTERQHMANRPPQQFSFQLEQFIEERKYVDSAPKNVNRLSF